MAEAAQSGALRRGELPDTCALMLARGKEHLNGGGSARPDAELTPVQRKDFRATIEEMTVGILAGVQTAQACKGRQTEKWSRRRGRKKLPAEEEQRRRKVLERWERASGECSRKQFCADEGITVAKLEAYQSWNKQRKNRAQ